MEKDAAGLLHIVFSLDTLIPSLLFCLLFIGLSLSTGISLIFHNTENVCTENWPAGRAVTIAVHPAVSNLQDSKYY